MILSIGIILSFIIVIAVSLYYKVFKKEKTLYKKYKIPKGHEFSESFYGDVLRTPMVTTEEFIMCIKKHDENYQDATIEGIEITTTDNDRMTYEEFCKLSDKDFVINDSIKFRNNCEEWTHEYRVSIKDNQEGHVSFDVIEVNEEHISNLIELGITKGTGDYVFSCSMTRNALLPHYRSEKTSHYKYNIQLDDLEDMKNFHDDMHSICEMMYNKYINLE